MTTTLIILVITVALLIGQGEGRHRGAYRPGCTPGSGYPDACRGAGGLLFAHRHHDDRTLRGGWSYHADRTCQAYGQ